MQPIWYLPPAHRRPTLISIRTGWGQRSPRIEKLETIGFELIPKEAMLYRALSARCNDLAQDRFDIAFAAKELCRGFATPTKSSYARLEQLDRYIVEMPRLVYE